MSDGAFWKGIKEKARADGLSVTVDHMAQLAEHYKKVLESMADPCDGCRDGLVKCSHAIVARIALGVPPSEASELKSYAGWKKAEEVQKAEQRKAFRVIDEVFGGQDAKKPRRPK